MIFSLFLVCIFPTIFNVSKKNEKLFSPVFNQFANSRIAMKLDATDLLNIFWVFFLFRKINLISRLSKFVEGFKCLSVVYQLCLYIILFKNLYSEYYVDIHAHSHFTKLNSFWYQISFSCCSPDLVQVSRIQRAIPLCLVFLFTDGHTKLLLPWLYIQILPVRSFRSKMWACCRYTLYNVCDYFSLS